MPQMSRERDGAGAATVADRLESSRARRGRENCRATLNPACGCAAEMETHGSRGTGGELRSPARRWTRDCRYTARDDRAGRIRVHNLNSPKQLAQALCEDLGSPAGRTPSRVTTNAEVLIELRFAHPVIEMKRDYRTLSKPKSTY